MSFPVLYPSALRDHFNKVRVVGRFTGKPVGVTVHYTADRKLDRSIKSLISQNLGYHILIDRVGMVYQLAAFDGRLWHAGKATWNDYSPNRAHIAVAVLSYGLLTKTRDGFKNWINEPIPPQEIAIRRRNAWDAATQQQEESLVAFLRWSVDNGIDPDMVCGHSECCIPSGRKIDPGGVLEKTMDAIRDDLRDYRKAKGMAII